MNHTVYRAVRAIGPCNYTCESFDSMEDATLDCYASAHINGHWKPAPLRTAWWQFWRSPTYTPFTLQIKQRIIERGDVWLP